MATSADSIELAFYGAVLVVIVARTTNMWAHAEDASPTLAKFRTGAPLFRIPMILSGGAIGVLSIAEGAFGHAASNLLLAGLVLFPSLATAPAVARTARALAAPPLLLGGVLLGLAAGFVQGDPRSDLGLGLNYAGSWMLLVAFTAMLAERWGPASAATRAYAILCTAFDAVLLASALLLGIVPLVVLEAYALLVDLLRLRRT